MEHPGWVLVQRFFVPRFVLDVRQSSCGPELGLLNKHSQQSREVTKNKKIKPQILIYFKVGSSVPPKLSIIISVSLPISVVIVRTNDIRTNEFLIFL